MRNIFATLILILLLVSCKKEIVLHLNSYDPQVVIQANISNDIGPYFVNISKTVKFSDSGGYTPVTNAEVIISDDTGVIDTLTEVEPGKYETNILKGIPDHIYNLKVVAEDKHFYATSRMPEIVTLDSLVFTRMNPNGGKIYYTTPVFKDPCHLVNYYRFIQTINEKTDNAYFVINDNLNDGMTNNIPIFGDIFPRTADTVTVEMRCIDKCTYLYFMALNKVEGLNYFSTPVNPPNNITGDYALGYFSAYTVQRREQIVGSR